VGRVAVLAAAAAVLAGCGGQPTLPFKDVDRSWQKDGAAVVATGDGPYRLTYYRASSGARHVLASAIPWQLDARAVRFADVTGDGRADILLTILCGDCNHAVAAVSVWTNKGHPIYGGRNFFDEQKPAAKVPGREIAETAWGATNGLLWFDTPGPGSSVCCPRFRLHTLLRWTGRTWRPVSRTRASSSDDAWLRNGPYPAP
jgi:hypothetical protein